LSVLEGKIAAVTGGAFGIGDAIAAKFIAESARGAVIDMKGADAAASALGPSNESLPRRRSGPTTVEAALRAIADHFGGLHCRRAAWHSRIRPL
jgi:NAD(P)-dependent dehydrogenase (short-subunit alcohol dehydrogenase family)